MVHVLSELAPALRLLDLSCSLLHGNHDAPLEAALAEALGAACDLRTDDDDDGGFKDASVLATWAGVADGLADTLYFWDTHMFDGSGILGWALFGARRGVVLVRLPLHPPDGGAVESRLVALRLRRHWRGAIGTAQPVAGRFGRASGGAGVVRPGR
jgi:hypothetical protein